MEIYKKFFRRFTFNPLSLFGEEQKRPLGRWIISQDNEKAHKKADRSNEDHCGPCGQNSIYNGTLNGVPTLSNVHQPKKENIPLKKT